MHSKATSWLVTREHITQHFYAHFFLHDIPAHGSAPQYQVWLQKVAYKHSADWEQIFVMSVTALTPEDTIVLSLL